VQVNIKNLIDEVQCYQTVRDMRWPDGIACPSCQSIHIVKRGFDDTKPARQRYECHDCDQRFDDRPYWIPGSSAPALTKKGNAFLKPLKNKGCEEDGVTTMRRDGLGKFTTLESNKSLTYLAPWFQGNCRHAVAERARERGFPNANIY
jgi:hypothetical protein